ncbi:hypothetical protein ACLB2K_011644 [Fragaria x ananassa]
MSASFRCDGFQRRAVVAMVRSERFHGFREAMEAMKATNQVFFVIGLDDEDDDGGDDIDLSLQVLGDIFNDFLAKEN